MDYSENRTRQITSGVNITAEDNWNTVCYLHYNFTALSRSGQFLHVIYSILFQISLTAKTKASRQNTNMYTVNTENTHSTLRLNNKSQLSILDSFQSSEVLRLQESNTSLLFESKSLLLSSSLSAELYNINEFLSAYIVDRKLTLKQVPSRQYYYLSSLSYFPFRQSDLTQRNY